MKAVLCKEYGPPEKLVIEEVESPRAARGQVVISVKACSLSFPDTLLITNRYQFKPPLPFSPGGEIAGIIKELGEDVEGLRVGERVIAFSGWGGFAEEIVLDARRVIPIPETLDFSLASTLVMTYSTSHYALKDKARLQAGEKLLVLGASGGVGLAAIEIGKLMGAHVIAAASSDEKLSLCMRSGADQVINYTHQDLKERIKALTNEKGADVIFDPVGGDYAEPALRGIAWNGRYLVVGFAAGAIPRIPLNLALLKGCSIVGVFWGAFATREPEHNLENLHELIYWCDEGKLAPYISQVYPLERAPAAIAAMMEREVQGKIVIRVDPGTK